ncbi:MULTISPECIES: hypothetical protein [unclassified Gordonia (in: high G+C Gram-positive bacteria)]
MVRSGESRGTRAVPAWYGVLTERRGGPLAPRRAASRLSAYVYGNILVLAAVVLASSSTIDEGHAPLIVLGTGVTTYIAHVFADLLAHANVPEAHEEEHGGELSREQVRGLAVDELRDAVPIMSSAVWPAIALTLGYHEFIPTEAPQLIAGAIVVARIASVPIVTERVRGNRLDARMVGAGLIAAVMAAVIVLLKTLIGH